MKLGTLTAAMVLPFLAACSGSADMRDVTRRSADYVNELKNGQGPAPLRTDDGWLHLAHGVRTTAAGLRYVLYMFMTDLDEPWKVVRRPAGHLIAPRGAERIGDVSNVAFSGPAAMAPPDEIVGRIVEALDDHAPGWTG